MNINPYVKIFMHKESNTNLIYAFECYHPRMGAAPGAYTEWFT